jgi:hypothetical protein
MRRLTRMRWFHRLEPITGDATSCRIRSAIAGVARSTRDRPLLRPSAAATVRCCDRPLLEGWLPATVVTLGEAGIRPAPAGGPDVWEVIRAIKSAHAAEPRLDSADLVSLVSDNTGIALRLVTTAVRYWAAYPGEVDAEIAAADAAEEAAGQAGLRERQLLAYRPPALGGARMPPRYGWFHRNRMPDMRRLPEAAGQPDSAWGQSRQFRMGPVPPNRQGRYRL